MSIKRFLFIYLSSVFVAIANGTCYWIDGTEATNRVPCSDLSSVGASMCCDRDSSEFFDSCADGICAYTYASGVQGRYDNGRSYWRDSCSDPTWRDPACVKMATYVTAEQVRLSKCADGSFCPRNTDDLNTTCCDNHQGDFAQMTSATFSALSTSSTASPKVGPSTSLSHSSSASSTASLDAETSTSLSQSSSASSTASLDAETSTSFSQSSSASSTAKSGISTSTPPSQNSQGGGNVLSKAAEIATIIGSVLAALALVSTIVFKWRKGQSRRRQYQVT